MIRNTFIVTVIILLASLSAGCGGSGVVFPPVDLTGDINLIIANSLGETISIASRTDGQWSIQTDVIPTGQAANDIVVQGNRAYIINSLSNSIHIINTETFATIMEISTGEGTNPYAAAMDDNGTLWVTLSLMNQLVQIDPDAAEPILRTITLPGGIPPEGVTDLLHPWPSGLCYHKGKVYVAHSNLSSALLGPNKEGAITIVNADSGVIEDKFDIAGWNTIDVYCPDPEGDLLYFVSAGEYFGGESGLIEVYDTTLGQVTGSVSLDGGPWSMTMAPSGAAYTTNSETGEILRFDANTLTAWPSLPLPDSGTGYNFIPGLCLTGENELAVLEFNGDKLYIIDGLTGEIKWSAVAGDGPYAITVLP